MEDEHALLSVRKKTKNFTVNNVVPFRLVSSRFISSFGILPLEPSPGDPSYLQNYSHSGTGMEPPPPPGPPKKVASLVSWFTSGCNPRV